jgi:hypothetical protein
MQSELTCLAIAIEQFFLKGKPDGALFIITGKQSYIFTNEKKTIGVSLPKRNS